MEKIKKQLSLSFDSYYELGRRHSIERARLEVDLAFSCGTGFGSKVHEMVKEALSKVPIVHQESEDQIER